MNGVTITYILFVMKHHKIVIWIQTVPFAGEKNNVSIICRPIDCSVTLFSGTPGDHDSSSSPSIPSRPSLH